MNASVSQGPLPSHERCGLGRLIEVPFITESFELTHNQIPQRMAPKIVSLEHPTGIAR